jgi:lipoprotein-anchoring transpeptidase ErfK/SrfK
LAHRSTASTAPNEPHTIGQALSSGCIRMTNDDVVDLYERVRVGAKVLVI